MAVGPATSWSFSVLWDGTTPVEESANIEAAQGVTITRGRGSEADDIQPGVLSTSLWNLDGRYTPDNPLSALYPNVKDGAKTRFSVTRGGVTSFRHRGRLAVGAPVMDDGHPAKARVDVQSVDMLGVLAGRVLRPDYVERWLNTAETKTVDLWPMEGTTLENLGSGTGTARIVPTLTGVGTYAVGNPDGVDLASTIDLTCTTNFIGPVIQCDTSVASGSVNLIAIPFRTADRIPTGAQSKYLAVGLNAAGTQVWALQLVDTSGRTDVVFLDTAGSTTLYSGFSPVGADTGDDQWFVFTLLYSGGTQFSILTRVSDASIVSSFGPMQDCRSTQTVVLGGYLSARRTPGKQIACVSGSYGAVVMSDDTNWTVYSLLTPNTETTADGRYGDLNLYADFASSTSGTTDKAVARKALAGRTAFDAIAEVARTSGGVAVASRTSDDTLTFLQPDTQRLSTVAVTVDVDADADGSGGFEWRKGDAPTRVTASYPGGEVVYDTGLTPRVESSVDTCAADANGARDVASYYANRSRRLRLTRLVVDLASASNDLWSSLMALEVGGRIRVTIGASTTTAVTQYGYTYVDVYAAGWTEHYGQDYAFWEIDTVPADDPIEAFSDDTTYARAAADSMTATAGTATGTNTGTVTVTTASGLILSTAAGDYPQDFSWNGERVTVSGVTGAASPQTATITARGVAPSVARSHSSGEAWDVWLPAAAAF